MIIFKKADQLSHYIQQQKENQHRIGFVPTMGALHAGHLSLIQLSKEKNDKTVCSIFVNPTQFNNPDDFKYYPVTIEKDIELLINAGCDILFLPSVAEIYPESYQAKHYDLGKMETVLEGYYRPGHFQGVCQVMDRLLQLVNPDTLFMGQKDYQQCMVIKKLLPLLNKEQQVILEMAPTKREPDGLAMSSRNLRLSAEERQQAAAIFKALNYIKGNIHHLSIADLKIKATELLQRHGFEVDYVAICHAKNLEPAEEFSPPLIALIAATIGKVRLIDNLLLN